MRNVYFYIGLLMLLCTRGFCQGTDVIFLIDNSASITGAVGTTGAPGTEYYDMYNSIQAIMGEVLNCNPDNKITIIQYSTNTNARIWVESDFTSTGYGFSRRYNNTGDIPGSVNLISYVLAGTTPPASIGTISGTTSLHRTPGNALAVFLFTDAPRANDLLSNNVAPPNNNAGFSAYTDFKINEGAKFVVVNTDTPSNAASAGVASKGGSWPSPIESYSDDPDGAGMPNRMFIPTSFALEYNQIQTVTDFICSITVSDCESETIVLASVADDTSFTDNRQASLLITASNKIYSGGVGLYRSETEVALVSGFHVNAGSRFRGFIEECQEPFEGRMGQFDTNDEQQPLEEQMSFFNIAPNPANSVITITGTEAIQSILITSLDGKTLYSNTLQDKTNSFDVIIDGYSKGMYNVTVTMANGKVETQKLVKN